MRPQQKNSNAPKRMAAMPATTMPTIAPLEKPLELGVFNGGMDVEVIEDEGRIEDAGLLEGGGDSAGKGSPGCYQYVEVAIERRKAHRVVACKLSPWLGSAACQCSWCCSN